MAAAGHQSIVAACHQASSKAAGAVLPAQLPVRPEVLVCAEQHHGSSHHSAAGLEAWAGLVPLLRCHHHAYCLLRKGETTQTS